MMPQCEVKRSGEFIPGLALLLGEAFAKKFHEPVEIPATKKHQSQSRQQRGERCSKHCKGHVFHKLEFPQPGGGRNQ